MNHEVENNDGLFVRLPSNLKESFKEACARDSVSMSYVVKRLIESYAKGKIAVSSEPRITRL